MTKKRILPETFDELTEDEKRRFMRYVYLKKHAPYLYEPGIEFTDEQKKMIQDLVASGETVKAQAIILDQLKKEFPNAE